MDEQTIQALRKRVEELSKQSDQEKAESAAEISSDLLEMREQAEQYLSELKKTFSARKRSIEKKLEQLGDHEGDAEAVLAFKKRFHALERDWQLCLTEYDHALQHGGDAEETKEKIDKSRQKIYRDYKKNAPTENTVSRERRAEQEKADRINAEIEALKLDKDPKYLDIFILTKPNDPESKLHLKVIDVQDKKLVLEIVSAGHLKGKKHTASPDEWKQYGDMLEKVETPQEAEPPESPEAPEPPVETPEAKKARVDQELKALGLEKDPQFDDVFEAKDTAGNTIPVFKVVDVIGDFIEIEMLGGSDAGKTERISKDNWKDRVQDLEKAGTTPEAPEKKPGKGEFLFAGDIYKKGDKRLWGDKGNPEGLKEVEIEKVNDNGTLRVLINKRPRDIQESDWIGRNFEGFPENFAGREGWKVGDKVRIKQTDDTMGEYVVTELGIDKTLTLKHPDGTTKTYTEDELISFLSSQEDGGASVAYEKAKTIEQVKQKKLDIFKVAGRMPKAQDVIVFTKGEGDAAQQARFELEKIEFTDEDNIEQVEAYIIGILEEQKEDGSKTYAHVRLSSADIQRLKNGSFTLSVEKRTYFEVKNFQEILRVFSPENLAEAYTDLAHGRAEGKQKLQALFNLPEELQTPKTISDKEKKRVIEAYLQRNYGIETLEEFVSVWKSPEFFSAAYQLLGEMATATVDRMTNQEKSLIKYEQEEAQKQQGPKGFWRRAGDKIKRGIQASMPGVGGAVVGGFVTTMLTGGSAAVVGAGAASLGSLSNRLWKRFKHRDLAERRAVAEHDAREDALKKFGKQESDKFSSDRLQAILHTLLTKRKERNGNLPEMDQGDLRTEVLSELAMMEQNKNNRERARTYQLEKLSHILGRKNSEFRDPARDAIEVIQEKKKGEDGFWNATGKVIIGTMDFAGKSLGGALTGELWLHDESKKKRIAGDVLTSLMSGMIGASIMSTSGVLSKFATRFGFGALRGGVREAAGHKERHREQQQKQLVALERLLVSGKLTGMKDLQYRNQMAALEDLMNKKVDPTWNIVGSALRTGLTVATLGEIARRTQDWYADSDVPQHGYDPNGKYAPASMKGDFATPDPDNPIPPGMAKAFYAQDMEPPVEAGEPEAQAPQPTGGRAAVADTRPGAAEPEPTPKPVGGERVGDVVDAQAPNQEPLDHSAKLVTRGGEDGRDILDAGKREAPLTLRSEAAEYMSFHKSHGIEQVQPTAVRGATSIAGRALSESPIFGGSAEHPNQVFVKGNPGEHAQVFVKNSQGEVFQFSGEHLRSILRDLPEPAAAEVPVAEPVAAAPVEAEPAPELPLKGQVVEKLPARFNSSNRLLVHRTSAGDRLEVWQTNEGGRPMIYARSQDGTVIKNTFEELNQAGTQNPNSAEHAVAEQVTAAKQAAEQADNVLKFPERPRTAPGLKIKINAPTAQWTEQVLASDNPLGLGSDVQARVQDLDNQLQQAVQSGSQLKQAQVMTELQQYFAQMNPDANGLEIGPGIKIVIDPETSQWNSQVLDPSNPLNVSPEVQAQVRELEAQFERSATTDGDIIKQAEIMQKMQQLKLQTERGQLREVA